MRAASLVLVAGALLVTACAPEISSNTYYCGPERFCPPSLVCDDNVFSCVEDYQVTAFSCPDESEVFEPDDSPDTAMELGNAICGAGMLSNGLGCVQAQDADYIEFRSESSCGGADPHIEITLRYPVATMPLTVEVLDEAGTVLHVGEICTPEDNFSGREHLCIEMKPTAGDTYYVRVRGADGAADCSGDCSHNQYLIDIAYPLS